MGLFDFFKKKQEQKRYVKMLNNNYPIFSQFGNDIYASDVVQQAIFTIVNEMKKLNPKHIRRQGFDLQPVYDEYQTVLERPNELMTTSDLIEKVTWQVMLNYNAFIYIKHDYNNKPLALYPVEPSVVSFVQKGSTIYVDMSFKNGETYTIPYNSFIHIKTHYSVSELMGGNENGQPDNDALLKVLSLNDTLLQGVKKVLQSSFAINGIVKYNTMLDDGKVEKDIAKLEKQIQNSQSGLIGIDLKSDIVQFSRNLQIVDNSILQFIDDKILRFFGVPVEIVRGNYTTEQYQAFYQKTLEPLIINYGEAFTKSLFSEREKGYRNEIVFYPKELIFMNTSQTLEMVNLLGQSGALFENEKRVAFGMPPLPELNGVRLQSLNYIDTKLAQQYQSKNIQSDSVDNNKGGEDGKQGL